VRAAWCCALAALLIGAAPATSTGAARLSVVVTGFTSHRGQLMVALHDSPDTFLSRRAPFRAAIVAITSDTVLVEFKDVPAATYSLAAFHDENANGDLDGVLRIPRERYGFSNNPRGRFGPPSWRETTFVYAGTDTVISVRLRGALER
jgi:uncharacterized protein (DUF2141 family)